MSKVFEVWSEGYAATGDISTANFWGTAEAETFQEACEKLLGKDLDRTDIPDRDFYRAKRPSVWGCRLFDNEAEARKTFG